MEKKGNYDNKNPAWSCEGQVGGSRKQLQLFEVLKKKKFLSRNQNRYCHGY